MSTTKLDQGIDFKVRHRLTGRIYKAIDDYTTTVVLEDVVTGDIEFVPFDEYIKDYKENPLDG